MTSRFDDKALQAQGRSGTEGTRDNVVVLTPKARIDSVGRKHVAKLPVPDQKAAPPAHDGNDDPGPSAA